MTSLSDQTDTILAGLLDRLQREAVKVAADDPVRVAHELRVRQIELELQNRELRAAQQALEESRDTYADLYDFAPVAYVSVSREGRITRLNLTAAQLLGLERGRIEGLFLGSWLVPEDGLVLLRSLGRVLSTGEEASIEVGLGRPPAARRTLRLTLRRDETCRREAPPTCRAILSDITEISQAHAALLAQRQFLQSVIDGVAEPILVIDTDYRVLLMNREARQAARVPAAGLAGLTCYGAIYGRATPCDSAAHRCPVREVLATGQPVKVVHRDPGADGKTRWIEVVGSPLLGLAGEVLGVIESSHDITDHLELTARLQERERQLQHLAEHDPLTGLPNRTLFADRLRQALRHAHRERCKVAVIFLDLDRFKPINDSLGHATGDLILQESARRMRALMREGDTVARVGGDEFTIVLGALARGSDAGLIAHKLLTAFEAPFELAERRL